MTSIFCPIFSGAQQQQSAFKPASFGATAQPAPTSGLFGFPAPVFGTDTGVAPATSAFGQPQQQAAGAFGQPQQQAGSIGLFGANSQALGKKPFFSLLQCRLSMKF